MSEMIDLTNAWLDWKETCAVDACSPENKNNLIKVAQGAINARIRRLNQDQSTPWKEYSDSKIPVSVFHELEVLLYKKQKINGIPFKVYLFDTIGKRDGGLGKNLTGYLINQTLVHLFYDKVSKQISLSSSDDDESGNLNAPEDRVKKLAALIDKNDPFNQIKDESSISDVVKNQMRNIIWEEWDDDIRLGVFCTMRGIPLSNPAIEPLFTRRKSALADAIHNAGKKMKESLAELGIDHHKDYLMILRRIVIPSLETYFTARKDQYAPIFKFPKQKY